GFQHGPAVKPRDLIQASVYLTMSSIQHGAHNAVFSIRCPDSQGLQRSDADDLGICRESQCFCDAQPNSQPCKRSGPDSHTYEFYSVGFHLGSIQEPLDTWQQSLTIELACREVDRSYQPLRVWRTDCRCKLI